MIADGTKAALLLLAGPCATGRRHDWYWSSANGYTCAVCEANVAAGLLDDPGAVRVFSRTMGSARRLLGRLFPRELTWEIRRSTSGCKAPGADHWWDCITTGRRCRRKG